MSGNPLLTDPRDGKIVGGFPVEIEEVPYQVSMLFRGSHFCGGSIISSTFILTAAHCVDSRSNPSLWSVRVGSSKHNSGGEIIKVKKVIPHSQYVSWNVDYDFALLELEVPIDLNKKKQIVELEDQQTKTADGTVCKVSGWGTTQMPWESTTMLRMVRVNVVDQEECETAYEKIGIITPRMICAGIKEGGKDSCQGDSGGPLLAEKSNKLIGVVR